MGAERDHKTHTTGKSSSDPVPFTHDSADLLSEFGGGLNRDTGTDAWEGFDPHRGPPPPLPTPPKKKK